MPVRTRLSVAVAVLVTLLIALSAVATGSLWSLRLEGAAVIAGLAGMLAVAAVLFAYAVGRELPEEEEGLDEPEIDAAPVPPPPAQRMPVRQARTAELPPEYLAAIRKGVQARHAAYRAQATQKPPRAAAR